MKKILFYLTLAVTAFTAQVRAETVTFSFSAANIYGRDGAKFSGDVTIKSAEFPDFSATGYCLNGNFIVTGTFEDDNYEDWKTYTFYFTFTDGDLAFFSDNSVRVYAADTSFSVPTVSNVGFGDMTSQTKDESNWAESGSTRLVKAIGEPSAGGSITVPQGVPPGEMVNIDVVPNPGYFVSDASSDPEAEIAIAAGVEGHVTVAVMAPELGKTKVTVRYGVTKYGIAIMDSEHGTVTTKPAESAAAGETVEIIAAPEEGYERDEMTVTKTDGTGTKVEVTPTGTGGTFVMPSCGVEVAVTFKAAAEPVATVKIGEGAAVEYTTIEAAWEAAKAGTKTTPATLTLLKDVTVTAKLIGPSNDDFSTIFDLNDKVITFIEGNDAHIVHQHGKLSVVDNAANKTTKYFEPDADGRWARTDAVTERAVQGGCFTGYAWFLMLEGGDVEISDVSFVGAKRNPIFTQSVDDLIYGKCSFSRVNFLGNVCEDDFGGNPGAISLACKEFQYLFEDCVFRENVSPSFGGAIGRVVVSGEYSTPRLVRCVFENNRSLESDGGAVRLDAPGRSQLSGAVPVVNAMVFEDCVFGGNVADGNGGAIAAYCNAQILLKNCVVTNNVAGGNGGGICMDGAELQQGSDPNDKFVLINTTITGNRASAQGGGVYFAQTKACLAAGTKVTMADGTEKAIEEVVEGDIVRTFDHESGKMSSARVYLAFKGETKDVPFTLTFDNGATLSIVGRHDLLEQTSLKYVTISAANAHQYVGAEFYGADGAWHALTGVTRGTQAVDYYSLYTAQHQNAYANGMLTASDDVDHLLNIYELDENLKADAAQLAADIVQYGLATFEECSTKYGMSRSWYDDAGAKYNYVAIGKGLATLEGLEALFAESTGRAVSPLTAAGTPETAAKGLAALPFVAVPNADPFSDYDVGVLTLGANVVITNNTTGDGQSNVYLNYPKDGEGATHISFIALAADHTGICVGVTTVQTPTEGMDVQFTDYGATAGDTALFTSDEGYSVICREKALFLSVNPPVEPVEYVAPVYNTAGDPKSGIDHWVTNSVSEYTAVTSDQTTWGAAGETSWYVVTNDVTIASRITCVGQVNLILADGAKLNAQVGITASTATEGYLGFTVYAQSEGETMGALVAIESVPEKHAGIGGFYDEAGGMMSCPGSNITINGGTVTAKGGENAEGNSGAGIGGGASGIGSNIVVNGGTVAATGGQYSAGIGGGQETGGSDITINGGTVTAVGGGRSAGIGGGYGNTGSGITINGGTVTAVGDCGAAAIGGGLVSVGSDISIANATLYLASPALNYEDELVSADVIGSGFSSEESSSGVTIDASAKVFFNLTGVQNLDGSWIEPISPMPTSFDGSTIMTPETAVERVLVGGMSALPGGQPLPFALTNAISGATGTITVNDEKGVQFANKLLKLPHADSKLTLTAEDPVTPTVVVTPTAEEHAKTVSVYTNETVEIAGPAPYVVYTNAAVKVVYTADEGYAFAGGATTWTTNFTASASSITVTIPEGEKPQEKKPCTDCITFSADKAFGIKLTKKGMPDEPSLEYSTDQINWSKVSVGTGYDAAKDGETYKIHFRGTGNQRLATSQTKYHTFTNTLGSAATAIACSGNIMTLLDYQKVAKGEEPTMDQYAFAYLFIGFTALTEAPELPAETLAKNCYQHMFTACTLLTVAPELPAETLTNACYQGMFKACTSLTSAPALPATTLASGCYQYMFQGCTALTVAPALPAPTLATSCYKSMFQGCTALTTAPALNATTLAGNCYGNMFDGCTSLTTAPALPATTLLRECYQNMFRACTSLMTAPALPAETLAMSCYQYMFFGCTSLTTVPALPATTLANKCYNGMFQGCTSLVVNKAAPGKEWKIPATSGEGATDWGADMFAGTGGDVTGTPELNTTYYIASAPKETDCITFSADAAFGIKLTKTGTLDDPSLEYSTDQINWSKVSVDTGYDAAKDGETYKIHFRGTGNKQLSKNPSMYHTFENTEGSAATAIACSGNIMTLLDYQTVAKGEEPTMDASAFYSLFWGFTALTAAPELPAETLALNCYFRMFKGCTALTAAPELPAMTLAQQCYGEMFQNCTSLTAAPELPAMTAAQDCYSRMFQGCTSLTAAPELNATTLTDNCYRYMFKNCTSLTAAPILPATTLARYCYNSMFDGCTSLTNAPALSATTLKNNCYSYMFRGCTSLTSVPELPATTLASGCYGYMFYGCTNITLYADGTGDTWSIPKGATGPEGWGAEMFTGTGGTLQGQPEIGKTYYYTPMPTVVVTPTEVANATVKVYTNGVEVALAGEPPSCNVYSNQTDTIIVYTADPGYAFEGGAATYTNDVDTTVNPAEIEGDVPSAPTKVVAKIGDVYYETLQAAFGAVKDGETITMVGDVEDLAITTSPYLTLAKGKAVTFDLAGHRIYGETATKGNTFMLQVNGDLTVTDSSEGKTGYFGVKALNPSEVAAYGNYLLYIPNGNVTLEAGTLENLSEGPACYVFQMGGESNSVTVNGGTARAVSPVARMFYYSAAPTMNFTLNGGLLESTSSVGIQYFAYSVSGRSAITVTGGEIKADKYGIYAYGTDGGLNVDISGGKITTANKDYSAICLYNYRPQAFDEPTSVNITGGTVVGSRFLMEVYDYYAVTRTTISDGTFGGQIYLYTEDASRIDQYRLDDYCVQISGGTFTNFGLYEGSQAKVYWENFSGLSLIGGAYDTRISTEPNPDGRVAEGYTYVWDEGRSLWLVVPGTIAGDVICEKGDETTIETAEKPAETKEQVWEAATNLVATAVTAEAPVIVADVELTNAVDQAKSEVPKGFTVIALFAEVNLTITPKSAVADDQDKVTAVTMNVTPSLMTWSVVDNGSGTITTNEVGEARDFEYSGKPMTVSFTVADMAYPPVQVVHRHSDDYAETYGRGELPSDTTFAYDAETQTITLMMRSFSDVEIYSAIQVGDTAWATIGADGACKVSGTGDMWSFDEPTSAVLWGNHAAIRRVDIGEGVTSVGKNAFAFQKGVLTITIGGGVTNICEDAFFSCLNVTDLSVGAGVQTVGKSAFGRCNSLTDLSFGSKEVAEACQGKAFKIVARITMNGSTPVIDAVPKVTIAGYVRTLYGAETLAGPWEAIADETNIPAKYHFFKYEYNAEEK